MIQRTILRASRHTRTPAFAPLRQSLVRTRVATPAIRWYSDAPAAPKEGETVAEQKEEAPNDEAAKVKQEVEKKDKEILDLKVGYT